LRRARLLAESSEKASLWVIIIKTWYKTYPPRTSRMAENAIAKLEEYKERRKLEA
jgi:hypothetical protein